MVGPTKKSQIVNLIDNLAYTRYKSLYDKEKNT